MQLPQSYQNGEGCSRCVRVCERLVLHTLSSGTDRYRTSQKAVQPRSFFLREGLENGPVVRVGASGRLWLEKGVEGPESDEAWLVDRGVASRAVSTIIRAQLKQLEEEGAPASAAHVTATDRQLLARH